MTNQKQHFQVSTATGTWSWPLPWRKYLIFVVAFAAGPILMMPSTPQLAFVFALFIGLCMIVSQGIIALLPVNTHSSLRWLMYVIVISVVALILQRCFVMYHYALFTQSNVVWAMGGAQLLILAHSEWIAARQSLLATLQSSGLCALIVLVFVVIMASIRHLGGHFFMSAGGGLIILALLVAVVSVDRQAPSKE